MESYTEKGKLSIELSQKVWACYESQLYTQIMTPLSQLYYLFYVDFASKLKEFIAKKSLIELGIDEPWLNDEMPTPPVAIKQKFHEHEEVSMALKDSLHCLLWRDTVSAGRRHTNGYELCPSSSRFIFILI